MRFEGYEDIVTHLKEISEDDGIPRLLAAVKELEDAFGEAEPEKRSDCQARLTTVQMKLKRGDKYCDDEERKSITKLDRRTWWRKRREGNAPNPFTRHGRNYWFKSELLSWSAGKKDWKFPIVDIS